MKTQLHSTIDSVIQSNWDEFANNDYYALNSHYLRAIEQSAINNLKTYYLTGSRNGGIDGIAYFFKFLLDFSSLNNDIKQSTLSTIKTWLPNFMFKNVLECGHIASLGETIVAKDEIFQKFLETAVEKIDEVVRDEPIDIVLIRDIPYHRFETYANVLLDHEFVPVLGFPKAEMEIQWDDFSEYLAALKSSRRWTILNHFKKYENSDLTFEVVEDFRHEAERLTALWKQVHGRAENYMHETLNPAYFSNFSQHLEDASKIITLKRNGEIVAFVSCMISDNVFSAEHIGIDYDLNEEYDLYFNIQLLCLKEAIRLKKKRVEFGISAYNFKMLIGCELQPMIYFLKHVQGPNYTAALVKMLEDSIEQPENNHKTFKGQDISNRLQMVDVRNDIKKIMKSPGNDVFSKAYRYSRAQSLKIADLYTFFPVFECPQRAVLQNFGEELIMLGSNSYLGLGSHDAMKETAKIATDIYGTGCTGSPIMNGTLDLHAELCRSLAKWIGKEDVVLYSTGYQTNLGVISTIVGRHEVVIIDSLNHASIVDGSLFCRGQIKKYKHDDFEDLERVLKENQDRPMLLVVDGVFSMEGTMIDLPAVVKLGKKYGARIMVDEAHGLGVLGENGRGSVEHFGLIDEVDLIMGTFSKSFASIGGFIATEGKVANFLKHVSRSHLFSASLPPSVVATVRKALDIIQSEPERRTKLLNNAKFMADQLEELGYEAKYHGTAIVPIYCRDELLTLAFFRKLYQEGVYVNPVMSPAVPKGSELLRTSYMATHDEEDLLKSLDVFKRLRTETFPVSR